MRCSLVLIAALLVAATAHKHGRKHGHRSHHQSHHQVHEKKHHAKKHQHEHKHELKHRAHLMSEASYAASYAMMESQLEQMLQHNTAAEENLGEASRRLEEALLDAALLEGPNASAPAATLRGAANKLPGNLSVTLKDQAGKLSELFAHLKSNIGDFNKREADQKKDSVAYADRLRERLKIDKEKLKNPKLSDFDREMLVNRTRTEEHEVKFWTQGRSLQHDMFHSNLKLTHGLMSRVKTVMEAYKQVLATGKLDAKLTQTLHDTSATLPKALIQKEQRVKKDVRKIEKHLHIGTELLQ